MKFLAIVLLALSTSAFAADPVCNDITTFPTVSKVVDGKTYDVPKCVKTCLNVTPYTHPRCVDYDNVLALRPRTKSPVVEAKVPTTVASTVLGARTPGAAVIQCLDLSTFPHVSKGGVSFPVCVTECATATASTFTASWAAVRLSVITLAPADAALVKTGMIVTGFGIANGTKTTTVDATTGLVHITIPTTIAYPAGTPVVFTTPGIKPPVCVNYEPPAP